MPFHSISISTNTNLFIIIFGSLLLAAYSFYIYRFTIPQVTQLLRFFLIALRSIVIILILFLLFEPVFTFIKKETIEPKINVFIDNSASMSVQDSTKRLEQTNQIINEVKGLGGDNTVFYTFGSKIQQIDFDNYESIKFNEPLTNFSIPVEYLRNSRENIAASIFISDGLITDGIVPIYEVEKLQFPVFTVGLGDTTLNKDISIRDVIFNRFIYAGKTTEIEALVSQFGFDNQKVKVSLYDENIHVQTNEISLNPDGINKVQFEYTSKNSGERKMFISVQPKDDEHNYDNNRKSFFINVLNDKVKIGILAGTPSPDVSSISNILEENENLKIIKLIQISNDKYFNENKSSVVIDSSDILFLIDFPSSNTKRELIDKVISVIETSNKPFFISVTPYGNIQALRSIERILPFSIGKITDDVIQTETDISGTMLSLILSQSLTRSNIWNNLPPLSKYSAELIPKAGSNVLIKSRLRNTILPSPILFSRNIGNQMSIALLAGDVWRWRLSSSERNPDFFNSLFNDMVRWLSSSGKEKQFVVSSSKKIYSKGENVEFTAELYDQTFSPIDSANIELTIFKDESTYKISFEKIKEGRFEAIFDSPLSGDYSYKAEAQFNGNNLESSIGRFSIGDADIERQITRMDKNFLEIIANSTNGKFVFAEDFGLVKEELQSIIYNTEKDKLSYTEINLYKNHWIMFLIICLFALEWFIRKRNGML